LEIVFVLLIFERNFADVSWWDPNWLGLLFYRGLWLFYNWFWFFRDRFWFFFNW
jgi:hypothetical protein